MTAPRGFHDAVRRRKTEIAATREARIADELVDRDVVECCECAGTGLDGRNEAPCLYCSGTGYWLGSY